MGIWFRAHSNSIGVYPHEEIHSNTSSLISQAYCSGLSSISQNIIVETP